MDKTSRRKFLKRTLLASGAIGATGLGAWFYHFDGPLFNACSPAALPESLARHPLMRKALDGIYLEQLWDCHFHLVGSGQQLLSDGSESGIWLNPKMYQGWQLMQRLQYQFYLDAACINDSDNADQLNLDRVFEMSAQLPAGMRFMLLAFDYYHNDQGQIDKPQSTFYVPNQFAANVARSNKSLEWIASVHPYREDALEQLEWCAANGARAIKWLPPAMNIDPASERCDSYYQKLVELDIPLLTHAGEEKAVHSEELQTLANPLFLRKPLEQGVKVIIAHCASLGTSEDVESPSRQLTSNFELFMRLMDDKNYDSQLMADISAINLVNRDPEVIKTLLNKPQWHSRLLYASDYPLTGVIPVISNRALARAGVLSSEAVSFLNQVRPHNSWLFDLLQKRLLSFNGLQFSDSVFSTRRHFEREL